jgi:hypothetical protein
MFRSGTEDMDRNPQSAGRARRFLDVKFGGWIGRIDEVGDRGSGGQEFFQELRAFRRNVVREKTHASEVTTRSIEARHQPDTDRVADGREYDRNCLRCSFGGQCRRRATRREQHCDAQIDEFCRERTQPVISPFRPSECN